MRISSRVTYTLETLYKQTGLNKQDPYDVESIAKEKSLERNGSRRLGSNSKEQNHIPSKGNNDPNLKKRKSKRRSSRLSKVAHDKLLKRISANIDPLKVDPVDINPLMLKTRESQNSAVGSQKSSGKRPKNFLFKETNKSLNKVSNKSLRNESKKSLTKMSKKSSRNESKKSLTKMSKKSSRNESKKSLIKMSNKSLRNESKKSLKKEAIDSLGNGQEAGQRAQGDTWENITTQVTTTNTTETNRSEMRPLGEAVANQSQEPLGNIKNGQEGQQPIFNLLKAQTHLTEAEPAPTNKMADQRGRNLDQIPDSLMNSNFLIKEATPEGSSPSKLTLIAD